MEAMGVQTEVDLVEDLVVLRLANRVPLCYRIELFVEHRFDGLALEVEQDGPRLRHIAHIDIDEVQNVHI